MTTITRALSIACILLILPLFLGTYNQISAQDMRIEGVLDGPLGGGTPKAVEFYVINDIADLSLYGFGSANNGGGTEGQEFIFSGSAVAGQSIFVASEAINFFNWFGFSADFTSGASNINGDDAIELFYNGSVIDIFGEIDVDGTGEPWEYLDGWAKRVSGGPDGTMFVLENWTFSGRNALDGETDNQSASDPYPGMYLLDCVGDAGPNQVIFVDQTAQLGASTNELGSWSGGLGMFSDVNDPNATYTPNASEANSTVQLVWTVEDRTIYDVSRSINDGTVTGTISTDGTTGVIGQSNILDWNLVINDGVNSVQIFGPQSGNNSAFAIIGDGFTATLDQLIFDFSSIGSSYNFQGAGGIWCITGPSFICGLSTLPNAESIQVSDAVNMDDVQRTGPIEMASGMNTSCGQATYTTNLGVFGYPDAEFFFDPAMICPRMATEFPQHTTGIDGSYSYEVLSGGPFLDLERTTGKIESDNSDIGVYTVTNTVGACGNLAITGVIDGPLGGGNPKAVELTALNDIPDLSTYRIDVAFNGSPTSGQYVILDQVELARGDKYYVAGSDNGGESAFESFFGFAADQVTPFLDPNGDDVILLSCNGIIFDAFGELGVDGSGEPWEYRDGWAYRNSDTDPNHIFNNQDWTYSGRDALDGETTNTSAASPMPVGMYTNMAFMGVPNDIQTFDVTVDYDDAPVESMNCIGHLNVSIDPAICGAEINYLQLMPGLDPAACLGYDVQIEGLEGNTIYSPGVYQARAVSLYDGNFCWTTITVEEKVAPVMTCPIDVTISCADPSDPESIASSGVYDDLRLVNGTDYNGAENALLWAVDVQECSDFTLTYSDEFIKGDCDGDIINRTFTAIDEFGMSAACTQTIYLQPEDISDVTLPLDFDCIDLEPDFEIIEMEMDDFAFSGCGTKNLPLGTVYRTGVLTCDGAGTVWTALENGLPSPYDDFDVAGNLVTHGTGSPGGLGCGTIQKAYNDIVIDICEDGCVQNSASFKVVRQWTILDWCSGSIEEHNQIIKVMDTEAPTFEELPDVTINTSLWDCSASYDLPSAPLGDNCSVDIHVSWTSSIGVVTEGTLYLADNAKTMPGEEVEVYVSYSDCCENIGIDTFLITVVDMVPPVPVADAHTVVSLSENYGEGLAKIYAETFDDGSWDNCSPVGMSVRRLSGTCSGYSSESKFDREFDNIIHFCCKDVGKTIMVEFQVCDDADMDGIYGSYWDAEEEERVFSETDNCNTAMIEVEVQDKLAPACSVPGDVTINCIDFAALGDLVNSGTLNSGEKAQVDAMFGAADGAASCKVKIDQELTSTEDCGVGTVTRTVTVTNTNNDLTTVCTQIIHVEVEEDVNFLTCDDITFPEGSLEDELYRDYILSEYGTTSDYYPNYVWCLMNPSGIDYDNNEESFDGENLPAIEVADCAGVTITAPIINIDNLCSEVGMNLELDTFEFAGGGCKKILAHWEVIDQCIFEENFEIDDEINPFVPENGYFEIYVEYDLFDTVGPEITCGEGFEVGCGEELTGSITASATDDCTTDPAFLGWSWRLDVGADNTFDFEGEGNSVSPADIGLTAFPEGNHSITWIVSDGCGNLSTMDCPFGLSIEDNKAPTPYCYDGLSSSVMLMNGVTLWAADFDAGSYDDCGGVYVTMIPEPDTEGLTDEEAYEASMNAVLNTVTGNMEYGWTFDCDYIPNGVSATIDVRIYATDDAGNWDYCTASFRLQDNLGGCPDSDGGLIAIGGNIATESGDFVPDVEVEAMTANPEFPKYELTDAMGDYAFFNNPTGYDYEIRASLDKDYTNGVSTLDLVLIQKHILSLKDLDSAYKMIAADINGDGSIKASDLLQLRKLILGLYSEDRLPSNSSWRFVDDSSVMDSENPWSFTEVVSLTSLASEVLNSDFTAVKIGDVNGSVVMNTNGNATVRTDKEIVMTVPSQSYKAGDKISMSFKSSDFNEIYGYQFTLGFDASMKFQGIESGALAVTESNFGLNRISEGVITTSFDNIEGSTVSADEVLFTINFEATENMDVQNSININSRYTASEAYVGSGLEVREVKLAYRTEEGQELAESYALYQNEPNPFRGSTIISFNLPKAANATFKVYDVTGKVLYRTNGDYVKGMNSLKIEGLNASGVMYYQLNTDDYSATKKMIVIE